MGGKVGQLSSVFYLKALDKTPFPLPDAPPCVRKGH